MLEINTKNFLHFLFSIALIFSILGPSISKLYNSDLQAIVFLDSSEEEKSGKTEKDVEEKLLQKIIVYGQVLFFLRNKTEFDQYLDTESNYVSQILLPPPEHMI